MKALLYFSPFNEPPKEIRLMHEKDMGPREQALRGALHHDLGFLGRIVLWNGEIQIRTANGAFGAKTIFPLSQRDTLENHFEDLKAAREVVQTIENEIQGLIESSSNWRKGF